MPEVPDDQLGDIDAARERMAQLRQALESRHAIGLAQGLLMNRYGLTVEQSFEYLRRRSQAENVKLRELAASVVAHHQSATGGHPEQ